MAMPSGNLMVSDKMQHNNRQYLVDERDGFISWLRGEFAAANAIIDSLCHHLRLVGESGEYDGVIGCIQQRRCSWNHVLHMQQYFSVAEVMYALQQVTFSKQQRFYDPVVKVNGVGVGGKARVGMGSRGGGGHKGDQINRNSNVEFYNGGNNGNLSDNSVGEKVKSGEVNDKDVILAKENNGASTKPQVDSSMKIPGNAESETDCDGNEVNADEKSKPKDTSHEKISQSVVAKTFIGSEMLDGKEVNVVDGMKLYEGLFDDSELSKLVGLVNDLRTAGRRGQFQGQTFVVAKRPTKGHGREMIQLGLPIVDAPSEYEPTGGNPKDRRIEPIPSLLLDVIERLVAKEIVSVKPDSCIIDIYNEGDFSQPHMWPNWFGRPVCVLFLTECDMTFGKVIGADQPGDYRGSLKLSLAPGSILLMQGKSADFAKHALPSIRKQRILVTLTKSQPRRILTDNTQRFPSNAAGAPPSQWVPPSSRSLNNHNIRYPAGPKHYVPVQPATGGVLPPPAVGRPQLPPPSGIQPFFVAAAAGAVVPPAIMSFPPPVALPPSTVSVWPAAAPPIRVLPPIPGTGVFLPPGSSNTLSQPSLTTATNGSFSSTNTAPLLDTCGNGKPDGNVEVDCNGSADGAGGDRTVAEEKLHENGDPKVAN